MLSYCKRKAGQIHERSFRFNDASSALGGRRRNEKCKLASLEHRKHLRFQRKENHFHGKSTLWLEQKDIKTKLLKVAIQNYVHSNLFHIGFDRIQRARS